jgi:RNA polymerase sigma-70 factor, ECF subfamily
VSRSAVELDEVDELLQAAGRGDFDAFASFYDRTAPAVFNHLHHVLGDTAAAERATVRVYVRVWRTAPDFDPAMMSGASFLLRACRPAPEVSDRA